MLRALAVVFLGVVLSACGATRAPAEDAPPQPLPPDATPLERLRVDNDVRPSSDFQVEGLTFYHVQMRNIPADGSGAPTIIAVDGTGEVVGGWDLFLRLGSQPADALARAALAMLLGHAGASPLTAADAHGPPPAEQWALVTPAAFEGHTLTFWTIEGEMAPTLQRVRVDLDARTVQKTSGADILHPPTDPMVDILAGLQSSDDGAIQRALTAAAALAQERQNGAAFPGHRPAADMLPDLVRRTAHASSPIRVLAIEVIGYLRDPRGVPELRRIGVETTTDASARSAVVRSLLAIGTPDALAAAREIAAQAPGMERTFLNQQIHEHEAPPAPPAAPAPPGA